MKLSQIKQALSIAAAVNTPVMIHGQPGMGKSEIVEQTCHDAAAALKLKGVAAYGHTYQEGDSPKEYFGLHDVRLSQCEPVDIRGLPLVKDGATSWAVPDWFPHTGRHDLPDSGILFLDELNGAPPSVQAAAYQLVNDRRTGDHVMKKGWSIVMAGNRMTDGGVTHNMPLPLCNRMTHIYGEVDVDEWRGWAMDNNVDVRVVGFVSMRPDLLNTFEEHVKKRLAGHAFCTPRSWNLAHKIISRKPSVDVLHALLNGTLGEGPAAELIGFMQVWDKMPNIDGILLDPQASPVPEDTATLYAVCTALAARAHPDCMDQIVEYLGRLPGEFSVLAMKDAQRRHGAPILSSPAFSRWANKNAKLLGG